MKHTTATNLQKAINNNLVTVVLAETESKETDEYRNIPVEEFINDLDHYCKSGVFADSLDFKYYITSDNTIKVKVGFLSNYCDECIKIALKLCFGVKMEEADKQLRETIFDRLSA